MQTDFLNKCKILGAIWIDQTDNPNFDEFIRFNDLGLPLAYAHSQDMAVINDKGMKYIEQSWAQLLAHPNFDLNDFPDTMDEEED